MADYTAQELQNMGQSAAQRWIKKASPSLNQAAASVVKEAGRMNREQVSRVVEATNQAAYSLAHNGGKLAAEGHRVVDFPGGPARVEEVLKQATGLPEPATYRDLSDYMDPPASREKKASLEEIMFGQEKVAFSWESENFLPDPCVGLVKIARRMQVLLDSAEGAVDSYDRQLEMSEARLVDAMKVAHLEGATLNDLVRAMASVSEDPAGMKLAFRSAYPVLKQAGGHTGASYADSMKTASAGVLDKGHPLLDAYRTFLDCHLKLAAALQVKAEISGDLEVFKGAVQQVSKLAESAPAAATGVADRLKAVMEGYKGFAQNAGQTAEGVAKALGGEGSMLHGASKHVGTAVKYAPIVPAGLLAYRGLQHARAAADSPLGRKVQSFIPGTDENLMEEQRIRQMYGANQGYGY